MSSKPIKYYIHLWLLGDERSFKYVFEYYYKWLLTYSRRFISVPEKSEEIVMNCLLKIYLSKDKLRDVDDFNSYLFGVLRREVALYMRKKEIVTSPIELVSEKEYFTIQPPEVHAKELNEQYQYALNKLPPKSREVFEMSREQFLSHKEIAEINNISVNTVSNHIKKAVAILKRELLNSSQ